MFKFTTISILKKFHLEDSGFMSQKFPTLLVSNIGTTLKFN